MATVAQNHVLSETNDWFDSVSVKRNMKELKGLTGQFKKTALRLISVNQRLSALYEDMGNILNRYYEIDEAIILLVRKMVMLITMVILMIVIDI